MSASRRITVLWIIAGIIILGGLGYFVWRTLHPQTIVVTQPKEEPYIPYYIFTESDAGTTTDVTIGGTAIVQLPEATFGEPFSATDAAGNAITAKLDNYSGSFVASFSIPTTTKVSISAHALKGASDFSMTLSATTTRH